MSHNLAALTIRVASLHLLLLDDQTIHVEMKHVLILSIDKNGINHKNIPSWINQKNREKEGMQGSKFIKEREEGHEEGKIATEWTKFIRTWTRRVQRRIYLREKAN